MTGPRLHGPRSKTAVLSACLIAIGSAHGPDISAEKRQLLGFGPETSAVQLDWEERLEADINAENLDAWMRFLTSRPHHVGSAFHREKIEFFAGLFRQWGYEVEVEEYRIVVPFPKNLGLTLSDDVNFSASFAEPPLATDESSGEQNILAIHNAFSPDGRVRAPTVYANFAQRADFEWLKRNGINVQDRLVIARYGRIFRGTKAKLAAEYGAAGLILYSDPRNDGYFQGDVIPRGPYRPMDAGERGSVINLAEYPGDPQTPGAAATDDAERVPIDTAPSIAPIPTLTINARDAAQILSSIDGPVAPLDWRGALPITYHVGPSAGTAELTALFEWTPTSIYNVIATLRGSSTPEQWIIRGNHHDAWVYGAADPISGVVALLEEARLVAALVAKGWAPKRTIKYALWDAEELGMIGSTEWVEKHRGELHEHGAIYVNSDLYSRGYLEVGGSQYFREFLDEVANDVLDPITGDTAKARLRQFVARDQRQFFNASSDIHSAIGEEIPVMPLGGGSDFTAFLHHAGVPTIQIGYFGDGLGGENHSRYDDYRNFIAFGDPGFAYGTTMVNTAGKIVLRLANADVLPVAFVGLSENLTSYWKELIASPEYTALGLGDVALESSLINLAASSKRLDRTLRCKKTTDRTNGSHDLNISLARLERDLTDSTGLPGRPWYRHLIYAPGSDTGYDAALYPGIREAIANGDKAQAEIEIARVADAISRLANSLNLLGVRAECQSK